MEINRKGAMTQGDRRVRLCTSRQPLEKLKPDLFLANRLRLAAFAAKKS
jgi:hypothetical protein